ncbi:MAG: serine/threonine protein kinase [Planctomycetaceae bacterium]|nr:serine/threonine protein kinase [Planctomycetaceae bacterium]
MAHQSTCPRCFAPLNHERADGLCPRCLLAGAFEDPGAAREPFGSNETFPGANGPLPVSQRNESGSPQGGHSLSDVVAPAPDAIAGLFPQLEILEMIGRGGMGAVYKVRQVKLDRIAALKIIRPDSAADPAFAERFNREAKTMARLNHRNIVGIYDFGEVFPNSAGSSSVAPLYYFLMEYVDGVNLRQVIASGRIPPDQAIGIIHQMCDALQYAHAEGVVHRDVKPENILLDRSGQVRVADFGLAKLGDEHSDFTLTGTHQVLGTVRYMAPEQMTASGQVDHRADIYSLGVVFYEMLTGEVPAGAFEVPSQKAGTDVRLDAVILRALASDPGRRFQSASEVASHIRTMSSALPATSAVADAAQWPGASTIIDNGVAAVVAGFRGVVAGTGRTPDDSPGGEPLGAAVGGSDGDSYVTLPMAMINQDNLPNVCLVCGAPTQRRQSKEFHYTSDLSGVLIFLGIVLFFPIGIVLAIVLTRKARISCPVCPTHRHHWLHMNLFAGVGWILIPIGLGIGLYFGGYPSSGDRSPWVLIPCLLVSVAMYVLPLIWFGITRVAVEEIRKDAVTLKRVSAGFARAVTAKTAGRTPEAG